MSRSRLTYKLLYGTYKLHILCVSMSLEAKRFARQTKVEVPDGVAFDAKFSAFDGSGWRNTELDKLFELKQVGNVVNPLTGYKFQAGVNKLDLSITLASSKVIETSTWALASHLQNIASFSESRHPDVKKGRGEKAEGKHLAAYDNFLRDAVTISFRARDNHKYPEHQAKHIDIGLGLFLNAISYHAEQGNHRAVAGLRKSFGYWLGGERKKTANVIERIDWTEYIRWMHYKPEQTATALGSLLMDPLLGAGADSRFSVSSQVDQLKQMFKDGVANGGAKAGEGNMLRLFQAFPGIVTNLDTIASVNGGVTTKAVQAVGEMLQSLNDPELIKYVGKILVAKEFSPYEGSDPITTYWRGEVKLMKDFCDAWDSTGGFMKSRTEPIKTVVRESGRPELIAPHAVKGAKVMTEAAKLNRDIRVQNVAAEELGALLDGEEVAESQALLLGRDPEIGARQDFVLNEMSKMRRDRIVVKEDLEAAFELDLGEQSIDEFIKTKITAGVLKDLGEDRYRWMSRSADFVEKKSFRSQELWSLALGVIRDNQLLPGIRQSVLSFTRAVEESLGVENAYAAEALMAFVFAGGAEMAEALVEVQSNLEAQMVLINELARVLSTDSAIAKELVRREEIGEGAKRTVSVLGTADKLASRWVVEYTDEQRIAMIKALGQSISAQRHKDTPMKPEHKKIISRLLSVFQYGSMWRINLGLKEIERLKGLGESEENTTLLEKERAKVADLVDSVSVGITSSMESHNAYLSKGLGLFYERLTTLALIAPGEVMSVLMTMFPGEIKSIKGKRKLSRERRKAYNSVVADRDATKVWVESGMIGPNVVDDKVVITRAIEVLREGLGEEGIGLFVRKYWELTEGMKFLDSVEAADQGTGMSFLLQKELAGLTEDVVGTEIDETLDRLKSWKTYIEKSKDKLATAASLGLDWLIATRYLARNDWDDDSIKEARRERFGEIIVDVLREGWNPDTHANMSIAELMDSFIPVKVDGTHVIVDDDQSLRYRRNDVEVSGGLVIAMAYTAAQQMLPRWKVEDLAKMDGESLMRHVLTVTRRNTENIPWFIKVARLIAVRDLPGLPGPRLPQDLTLDKDGGETRPEIAKEVLPFVAEVFRRYSTINGSGERLDNLTISAITGLGVLDIVNRDGSQSDDSVTITSRQEFDDLAAFASKITVDEADKQAIGQQIAQACRDEIREVAEIASGKPGQLVSVDSGAEAMMDVLKRYVSTNMSHVVDLGQALVQNSPLRITHTENGFRVDHGEVSFGVVGEDVASLTERVRDELQLPEIVATAKARVRSGVGEDVAQQLTTIYQSAQEGASLLTGVADDVSGKLHSNDLKNNGEDGVAAEGSSAGVLDTLGGAYMADRLQDADILSDVPRTIEALLAQFKTGGLMGASGQLAQSFVKSESEWLEFTTGLMVRVAEGDRDAIELLNGLRVIQNEITLANAEAIRNIQKAHVAGQVEIVNAEGVMAREAAIEQMGVIAAQVYKQGSEATRIMEESLPVLADEAKRMADSIAVIQQAAVKHQLDEIEWKAQFYGSGSWANILVGDLYKWMMGHGFYEGAELLIKELDLDAQEEKLIAIQKMIESRGEAVAELESGEEK